MRDRYFWTPEEEERLRNFLAQGMPPHKIAERMRRSHQAIRLKKMRMLRAQ